MADNTDLLTKNKTFLFGFNSFTRNQCTHLLKNATRSQVLSIVEIILNILRENIQIPDAVLNLMKKYKHIFRRLIEKQSWKKRRELLMKIGGVISKIFKKILNDVYEQIMNHEI